MATLWKRQQKHYIIFNNTDICMQVHKHSTHTHMYAQFFNCCLHSCKCMAKKCEVCPPHQGAQLWHGKENIPNFFFVTPIVCCFNLIAAWSVAQWMRIKSMLPLRLRKYGRIGHSQSQSTLPCKTYRWVTCPQSVTMNNSYNIYFVCLVTRAEICYSQTVQMQIL